MNAKDIKLENMRIKILISGAPKTGKTNIIGTFPGKAFVFDSDIGMLTLKGKDVYYEPFIDLDITKPTAFRSMQTIVKGFQKSAMEKGFVEYQGDKIDMVVVDTASSTLDLIMNQVLAMNGRAGQAPSTGDWKTNDYTVQKFLFTQFIFDLKALPCHLLVNCHEHLEKDEIQQTTYVLPAVTGSLATKIGGWFDFVFRSESVKVGDKTTYRLLTQNQGRFQAGTRLGATFEKYEPADFNVLLGKIAAEEAKEKAKGGE